MDRSTPLLKLGAYLLAVLVLALFAVQPAHADPPPTTFGQALQQALRAGRLQNDQALYWQWAAIYAPEQLPSFLRPTMPERSATLPLRHLRQSNSPAARLAAQRPQLPVERTLDTPHFRIHFTLSGSHAVPGDDANGNHIPDTVDALSGIAEQSWITLHRQLGWPLPQSDGERGGDDRTDIYLMNLRRVYLGYSDFDDGSCGDNAHTDQTESAACSAFIVLDRDMRGTGAPALALLRVSFAHEYMHVIQFGLDAREPADWLWEAWAVWAEDRVFDDINLYLNLLLPLFQHPDLPPAAHPYAMALLPMWMDQHLGAASVRAVWLQAVREDGMTAVAAALPHDTIALPQLWQTLAAALAHPTACPAAAPYCWSDGDRFPQVKIEGRMESPGVWDSEKQGNGRLGAYGQDYIALPSLPTEQRLILSSPSAPLLTLQVVIPNNASRTPITVLQAVRDGKGWVIDLPASTDSSAPIAVIAATQGEDVPAYALQLRPVSTPVPQTQYRLYLPQWLR